MARSALGIPDDILKIITERAEGFERQMTRAINVFFLCKHGLQSDQCKECHGMTAFGIHADTMAEFLRQRGLLIVETDAAPGARTPARSRRPLKTAIGVGIGVSFFLAFAGWKQGKFLLQLRNRGATGGT